jgi:hypothetical protein
MNCLKCNIYAAKKHYRCNIVLSLRCDLELGLPVWWPNSVQPFVPDVASSLPSGNKIVNLFKVENSIRGQCSTIQYHYQLVAELVDAYLESGLEIRPALAVTGASDAKEIADETVGEVFYFLSPLKA